MTTRRAALALLAALCLPLPHRARAQDDCIGRYTPDGLDFSGSGSTISEPFPLHAGAIFGEVRMSEAGAVKLMNADGDTVLLGNGAESYAASEAATVYSDDDYYLVIDFYVDEGDWAVTIEQP